MSILQGSGGAEGLPEAWVMGDLDLVRPLRLAGIPCGLVAPPRTAAAATRLARRVGWADPWREPQALLDLLLTQAAMTSEPPVLFYQFDPYAHFVSQHREELAAAFRFVICDQELLADCLDKTRFAALARRLDLPVPPSRVLSPAGPTPEELGLAFPLIVKPARHGPRGWAHVAGKRKAVRVDSAADWAALWPRLVEVELEVLVQEMVPGPETRIESYHAYVATDAGTVAEFTGRKLRTHPVEHGHTTALVVTEVEDVREVGRQVVGQLGLTGVVKLDFKRDPGGQLFLLEANPRFNLWHHPAAHTGVNIPARVWADLTGRPVPRSPKGLPEARWIGPRDVQAAREWGVGVGRWLQFAWSCEAKALGGWDDPRPLIRQAAGGARRSLVRS